MKTDVNNKKEVVKKGGFIRLTDAFNGNLILINIDTMYFIRRKASDSSGWVTSLSLRDRSSDIAVMETPEQIWEML